MSKFMKYPVELYCNVSNTLSTTSSDYINEILRIVSTAEKYRYKGALFHYNNNMLDPFLLASLVMQHTTEFQPIIASMPNYLSPFATVKKIQSIYMMYGKKININMITGAAKNELEQLSDYIAHEDRYQRLGEYIEIVKLLIKAKEPVSYNGKYFNYNKLDLGPVVPEQFWPEIYVAGSSDSSIQMGKKFADVHITHPGPLEYYKKNYIKKMGVTSIRKGIEIGFIARKTSAEAWDVANRLYPQSFIGNLHTKMKLMSESSWLREMAELGLASQRYDNVYWLGAFVSGLAHNPILVGSYDDITTYMKEYINLGVSVIILTELRSPLDFEHANEVIKQLI